MNKNGKTGWYKYFEELQHSNALSNRLYTLLDLLKMEHKFVPTDAMADLNSSLNECADDPRDKAVISEVLAAWQTRWMEKINTVSLLPPHVVETLKEFATKLGEECCCCRIAYTEETFDVLPACSHLLCKKCQIRIRAKIEAGSLPKCPLCRVQF